MTTNSQIDEMFISELGNEIVVCPLLDISPSSHPSGLLNILAYRDLTFAMEIIPGRAPGHIVGRLRGNNKPSISCHHPGGHLCQTTT